MGKGYNYVVDPQIVATMTQKQKEKMWKDWLSCKKCKFVAITARGLAIHTGRTHGRKHTTTTTV